MSSYDKRIPSSDKLIYAFVLALVVVVFFKERWSLGCEGVFKICDNQNAVPVKDTRSTITDNINKILQKIRYASDYTSRFVTWRRTIVISFVVMLMIWGLVLRRMPTGWEVLISLILIFTVITAVDGFYKYHLHDVVAKNVSQSVDLLSGKISGVGI